MLADYLVVPLDLPLQASEHPLGFCPYPCEAVLEFLARLPKKLPLGSYFGLHGL